MSDQKWSDEEIYSLCEQRGYFEVDGNQAIQKPGRNFSIMMPPPNVTGALHIGHALTFSLQDIIVRYKRMCGYKTLYQPGLDHAGIATQNVVEKLLLAKGISKEALGREEFIKKVWEWKEESGGKILHQMRRLGISPAFSRQRFTMDKGLENAVREAFVEWFNRGLIVQDDYMVNWCTHDGALSDIEVEYEQDFGKLYYLRYGIVKEGRESGEFIIVATTRPETYFGDTALMVNPQDPRYKHLVGQEALLPLLNRKIPIIADSYVDMEFGTGCVKVTPAHDINDYEVGKRHNLPSVVVFDSKGILNDKAVGFEGLERLEAREKIISKLQEHGYVEKIQDHQKSVGKCYRCGNVVEPYISKQWFVKSDVAKSSMEKIAQNQMQFFPKEWKNNYNAWMRDLRDWCISRQLWWGHRIPVWYCEACGEKSASKEAVLKSCPHCQSEKIHQDCDVLDTWFSSGLWAFSTLGWGNAKEAGALFSSTDLKDFYPNSLLITGFDILFFWVARMVFSGDSLLGELPFKDVYLHALVRDEKGQKMSKSRGNVIDPLDMIEVYGADNLRFSLALLCAQGRDVKLSIKRLDDTRAFLIKLENALKFLRLYASQQDENFKSFKELSSLSEYQTPLGRYMKSCLNNVAQKVSHELDSYRFNDAAMSIYSFLWFEFCDWGIELAKEQKSAVFELGAVFMEAMRLIHPFMPFVSERLYHDLRGTNLEQADSIMVSRFPDESARDEQLEQDFEVIKDCITSIRRAKILIDFGDRALQKISLKLNKAITLDTEILKGFVKKGAKVGEVELVQHRLDHGVGDVGEFCESFLLTEGLDLSAISARLNAQEAKLQKEIAKLEGTLKNQNFINNAPAEVLEQNQQNLKSAQERLAQIKEQKQALRLA